MLQVRRNVQTHPLARSEGLMTTPRPLLRLYLLLEAGSLLPVLECLQIAGQNPRLMVFHRDEDTVGQVILDFDKVNEPAAKAFVPWLEQLPGVVSVDTEWRPVRKPAE